MSYVVTRSFLMRLTLTVAVAIAAAMLGSSINELRSSRATAQIGTPFPSAANVPPAVQAAADRIVPSFDGIVRIDRKVIVRVADVPSRDVGIAGVTSGSWAVAVAGDIAQTWGPMARPNSQCAIWFINSRGDVFAFQNSVLSTCGPYFSAK